MATIGYMEPIVVNDCYVIHEYPEAASQTFTINDLVYLVSGKVTAIASDGTAILGKPLRAATGTTDTVIEVQVFKSGVEVEMTSTNGGSDIVSAVTDMGQKCSVYVASNKAYADISDNATDVMVPIRIANSVRSTIGDTNARFICQFLDAVLQSEGGAS